MANMEEDFTTLCALMAEMKVISEEIKPFEEERKLKLAELEELNLKIESKMQNLKIKQEEVVQIQQKINLAINTVTGISEINSRVNEATEQISEPVTWAGRTAIIPPITDIPSYENEFKDIKSHVITTFENSIDGKNMKPLLFELSSRLGERPKKPNGNHQFAAIETENPDIFLIVSPNNARSNHNGYDANINRSIGWTAVPRQSYVEEVKEAIDSVYYNTDLNIRDCDEVIILSRTENDDSNQHKFTYTFLKYIVDHH